MCFMRPPSWVRILSISFLLRYYLNLSGCITCFAEVYIDDLVVKEEHRGKGIGTKLIKEVENYYKDKNFNNMNLVTNGFQAPKFYEKCGFQLEFVRENKENPKLNKYFFVKYF